MIIAKLHNIYKELTLTEKKIASYVIKNPEKVVSMTIKELAHECESAPSAVNRMCKSAGAGGFAKLKIELARHIAKSDSKEKLPSFGENRDPETVFRHVFNSGIETLKNTLQLMDFDSVREIAQKIANAPRTVIFGVGTSSVIATDAAYRFSQLGIHAYAYTDILHMNVMAMNMCEGELAIGISHSGKTKAVVQAIQYAKNSGADTVALSSFAGSILCSEADRAITVFADEENYPIEAVSARIAHMCVIDALMMSLAAMKYDSLEEHINIRNKALEEMRY